MYISTKTFGHERGLSCAFRQWRATSHCKLIHGYAISVYLEFHTKTLDHRNWVVDFGDFGGVKHILEDTFDHKTLVASDDPELPIFERLAEKGVISLRVVPAVGCEAFSRMIFGAVKAWLNSDSNYAGRVMLHKVEVREHGANSAAYVEPTFKE